jgi:hypothetical protein
MPYTGGVGPYRGICNEVVSRGMLGFSLTGPNVQRQCNDGEIVRLQPDVRLVLNMMADMKMPPIESLGNMAAAGCWVTSSRTTHSAATWQRIDHLVGAGINHLDGVVVADRDEDVFLVFGVRNAARPLADLDRLYYLPFVRIDDRDGVALLVRDIMRRRYMPRRQSPRKTTRQGSAGATLPDAPKKAI